MCSRTYARTGAGSKRAAFGNLRVRGYRDFGCGIYFRGLGIVHGNRRGPGIHGGAARSQPGLVGVGVHGEYPRAPGEAGVEDGALHAGEPAPVHRAMSVRRRDADTVGGRRARGDRHIAYVYVRRVCREHPSQQAAVLVIARGGTDECDPLAPARQSNRCVGSLAADRTALFDNRLVGSGGGKPVHAPDEIEAHGPIYDYIEFGCQPRLMPIAINKNRLPALLKTRQAGLETLDQGFRGDTGEEGVVGGFVYEQAHVALVFPIRGK